MKGMCFEVVVYFMGIFDMVVLMGFGGSCLEKVVFYIVGVIFGLVYGGVLYGIDKGGYVEWVNDICIFDYVW